jgi:hypothetical protein
VPGQQGDVSCVLSNPHELLLLQLLW